MFPLISNKLTLVLFRFMSATEAYTLARGEAGGEACGEAPLSWNADRVIIAPPLEE